MQTESLIRCLEQCSEDKNSCEQCERYEKNVGSMRCVDNLLAEAAETIKSLNADLKESNKIVVQLRKQWQDAEMFICTMCGHFDHKTDGDIVYGNQDCGETVGYPYCKKFTPWVPVSVRKPKLKPCSAGTAYSEAVIVCTSGRKIMVAVWDGIDFLCDMEYWEAWGETITHWMPTNILLPLPAPPKEVTE